MTISSDLFRNYSDSALNCLLTKSVERHWILGCAIMIYATNATFHATACCITGMPRSL